MSGRKFLLHCFFVSLVSVLFSVWFFQTETYREYESFLMGLFQLLFLISFVLTFVVIGWAMSLYDRMPDEKPWEPVVLVIVFSFVIVNYSVTFTGIALDIAGRI